MDDYRDDLALTDELIDELDAEEVILPDIDEMAKAIRELTTQEKAKQLSLKLITGGKGPPSEPPGIGNCWLDGLVIGSVFYVQSKTDGMDFRVPMFRVEGRDHNVTMLQSPDAPGQLLPVNPVRFCNKFTLYLNKGPVDIPQEEGEITNDDGHRLQGNSGEPDARVD